ncbi:MAG: hypothetical protein A2057_12970 [Ignavibacteria bacterium GWA2_35_9]|nr:MAG: hypothetical protein A2057_12970 [Ignavibacteria bacterium GWA2_35_9]OGU43075.1 MAG: hypothetical protein A2000_03310 [Ignavibacteria bacterium GWB2_36_8]
MNLLKKISEFLRLNKSASKVKPSSDYEGKMQEKNESKEEKKGKSILFVSIVLVSGGLVLCIYSISLGINKFLFTISICAMIAFTSLIVGAFVGFIFGIPRTPATKSSKDIGANTNLEEISDWITKIIVGVSLVQLNQISGGITELGNTVSAGLDNHPSSFVFSVSTMIFYFVGGFLLAYLWSRIYLPKILRTSYEEGLEQKIIEQDKKLVEQVKKIEEQDIQADIRKKVDAIVLQSDPKNYKDFKSENFTKKNLQELIDSINENFDKPNAANLFGQIIVSLYNLPDYDLINELVDQFKNKIDINYGTWTDIALANMNLYNSDRQHIYAKRMNEAIENARKTIADYGVTYAIELYFDLIDLTYALDKKDSKLEAEVKEDIRYILNDLKSKPNVAAFETINYLSKNEGIPKWTDYNKMLSEMFPENYQEIVGKSNKYKAEYPDVVKYYEN